MMAKLMSDMKDSGEEIKPSLNKWKPSSVQRQDEVTENFTESLKSSCVLQGVPSLLFFVIY